MKISLNFVVRLIGMLAMAYLGADIGISLSVSSPDDTQLLATQLLMLAGAGLGLLVTPRLTIEPIQRFLKHIRSVPLNEIVFVAVGGFLGLLSGVLLTVPLSLLPSPLKNYLPIGIALALAYIGTMIFFSHKRSLQDLIRFFRRTASTRVPSPLPGEGGMPTQQRYILDTSAIIDGRIAAIGNTGFLQGLLLVPQFVLNELQTLADSSDDLRRNKGRRGLELLSQMQKELTLPVEFIDMDFHDLHRVDDKLVMLARQYHCPIITNDFNLNRVAELQGVRVLSLNELSDAIRPPVVQDQRLEVLIRNEGNARQQGVGYLEDGTPVIVEDARSMIGKSVEVIVTRLHQTQTGRLVFANLMNGSKSVEHSHTGKKPSKR
jgi:uncharacterized protein YacL